ncbi:MAG: FecR domain-containing protein [Kiritimatiellae bacterium]|nr:FecR domain-containing protein [Kiritimatiellia bacterium]
MAISLDRRLDPEPAWLFDETWCAVSECRHVSGSALFRRLGALDYSLLQQVRAAADSDVCRLPSGPAYVPGLGDPRETFHEELGRRVELCSYAAEGAVSEADLSEPEVAAVRAARWQPDGRLSRARRRPSRATLAGGRGARRRPVGVRAWGWWVTGMAAAALVGLGLLFHAWLPRVAPFSPDAAAVVRIERVEGDAFVTDGTRSRPAIGRELLPEGASLRTAGSRSAAVLRYTDGMRLELRSDALVERLPVARRGEVVFLKRGVLAVDDTRVSGAGRPSFRTPDADIALAGTRFVLSVAPGSTHIDLAEGDLLVTNRRTGKTVELNEGHYAVVGAATVVAAKPAVLGKQPAQTVRVTAGLQALYTFREGTGPLVQDVSGVGVPFDLTLSGSRWEWRPGGGLHFAAVNHDSVAAASDTRRKLYQPITASDELTVEVVLSTETLFQGGPARIVSYNHPEGVRKNRRNFAVGQAEDAFTFRLLTASAEKVYLTTPSGVVAARARLYHLVCTYKPADGMRIYVDGELKAFNNEDGGLDTAGPNPWGAGYVLALGNRGGSLDRAWQGSLFLAAVYSRAISSDEVLQNFHYVHARLAQR